MDVYVVGYSLEQNIMKFKANSSSPHPTPSEIKYEAARKRAIFPWVDLLEVASLSSIIHPKIFGGLLSNLLWFEL